jgi:hypothetical protein
MATVSIKKSDGSYCLVADTRVTDDIAGGGGSPVLKTGTAHNWEQYNSGWRAIIYDEDITDSRRVILRPTPQAVRDFSETGHILCAGEDSGTLQDFGESGYFYMYAFRSIVDNPENPVEPNYSPPPPAEFYYYRI